MPIYEYKGFDTGGGSRTGIIDADTPRDARARLRDQAILVTDLVMSEISTEKDDKPKRKGQWRNAIRFERRIKGADSLPMYTRQMATLLKSGIPLAQALTALIEQVEQRQMEAVYRDVREQVMRGASFADALELHPRVFDNLYVNMVRAGEASGNLDTVLAPCRRRRSGGNHHNPDGCGQCRHCSTRNDWQRASRSPGRGRPRGRCRRPPGCR